MAEVLEQFDMCSVCLIRCPENELLVHLRDMHPDFINQIHDAFKMEVKGQQDKDYKGSEVYCKVKLSCIKIENILKKHISLQNEKQLQGKEMSKDLYRTITEGQFVGMIDTIMVESLVKDLDNKLNCILNDLREDVKINSFNVRENFELSRVKVKKLVNFFEDKRRI